MRRISVLCFAAFLVLFLIPGPAGAGTIAKNTISLSGASNISYKASDYEGDVDQSSEFDLNVTVGYFFIDNFESGIMAKINFIDEQAINTTDMAIGPYVGYHFPFDPNFNFFIRGGLGYVKYDTDYADILSDLDADGLLLAGKIGFEYFLKKNVAINFGMVWQREELEINFAGITKNITITTYGPEVGIGLFF